MLQFEMQLDYMVYQFSIYYNQGSLDIYHRKLNYEL